MPKSTVRASAKALPKSTKRGDRERGLKTIAKRQAEAAKKNAPRPQDDVLLRLEGEQLAADAKLSAYLEQQRKEAENAKLEAEVDKSEAFSRAYARWLRACAHLEAPDLDRSEDAQFMKELYAEERAAQRDLFSIPAINRETVWNKLKVFEIDLIEELVVGPAADSVLLFALGSIKADLMNMDMEEEART